MVKEPYIREKLCSLVLLLIMCMGTLQIEAQQGVVPSDQVEALREVATQLGRKEWNFSANSCGHPMWNFSSTPDKIYNNTVECNCSSDGVCNIVSIFLKGQDLDGVLPPALAKLPHLKTIDLTRNYLTGPIPPQWASMRLEYMSLIVNRLTGPIPTYLGNFTTLIYMNLEGNMFTGTIPPELGKLVNLVNLILKANFLTGELPLALTNLINLTELRISSNNLTGKIPPHFIQSWKNLEKLEIQGSGLEGPIPYNISSLDKLTELRISDLHGEGSEFPPLSNMKGMKTLILRNCNIYGSIPPYISQMTSLKVLDLSFNRLSGDISFEGPATTKTMYLTSNLLNGSIPKWIGDRSADYKIDLSYNNFSRSSEISTCRENLNVFRSFSGGSNSIFGECPKKFSCSKDRYKLHINCGGSDITVGKDTYIGDEGEAAGAAFFKLIKGKFVISSTGDFMDLSSDNAPATYLATNLSVLKMNNSGLYTKARLSPLSLTYYGDCFANGNYTVTLYFAEIVIRSNRSFHSLGRRIFDVYIQDESKLQDFDIVKEAKGVDKPIFRNFTTVVRDGTIQIRFNWAGKGTSVAPRKGTYGPLISAISVEPNFKPPHNNKRKTYIIVGALVICLTILLFGMLLWKGWLGHKTSREQDLKGLDLQTGFFTFRQIKAATNNFDAANKIGEGGFGSVFKGILLDGTTIAVKQLSSKSKQGNREFVNEIGMISGLQHPNLVRLYGCCIEGNQLLLVYEYMENNSLARALFGPEENQIELDWLTRQRICVGIARGLAFLHEESTLRIVHRDIKTTNVLLDRDLNPKISDFGLAKLDEEENTHISTRVAGTIGYMAPEYALWGYLTYKADVYSFGVVTLEIVAGKSNMKYRPNENYVCLVDWALVLQQKGNLMELVDPKLGSEYNNEEAIRMTNVALLCTNPSPALRPTMSAVVSMLEGQAPVPELIMDPSIYNDEMRFQALRDQFNKIHHQNSSETQAILHSSDAPYASSSTSAQDLYKISFDSQ